MMPGVPFYLVLIFIATTLLTIGIFYVACQRSVKTMVVLAAWIVLQGIVGYMGFYLDTYNMPPRFVLLIGPPLLLIVLLFITKKGRLFIDSLDVRMLTFLHVVRVPVEMVLLGLFVHGAIPELMTFEGRNFDVFSGITAPLMAWWGYRKVEYKPLLMAWNFVCLALLLNIVLHAILSAPTPFQQIAFDQPNIGVLFFPFVWLPCCIVPLVFFSHLVCLRKLFRY